VCVRELRQALGDAARTPRYIETVQRRGYRFIARIETSDLASTGASIEPDAPHPTPSAPLLVGRTADLARLHDALARALTGERQVLFVAGEPGIGKTTLLEAFRSEIERGRRPPWVARGSCIEEYGSGEPYLPVLEGLGRLCRTRPGARLVTLLRRHAPSWLLHLPGIIKPPERAALARGYAGSSSDRMLREMVVGLEALTADTPLVLMLEDLHWSDQSTLAFIAALARRTDKARVLVLGSYRSSEAGQTPLAVIVRELLLHRQASELPLARLEPEAVAAYLDLRFAGSALDPSVARAVHSQTGGNPLFMVNVTDHLVACGIVVESEGTWVLRGSHADIERAVPESLRRMIERYVEGLDAVTWRLLEAASVVGVDFTARAVAAASGEPLDTVEERCRQLVHQHSVIQTLGSTRWPDGEVTGRYRFLHALYHAVLYGGLSTSRRADMHRRVGLAIEAAWSAQPDEVGALLAMHFERANDPARALRYRRVAGDTAVRRHAYEEAIDHYAHALRQLDQLMPGRERDIEELHTRVALGVPLINAKGFGAPDVEESYTRALHLCRQLGETPQLFPVLEGLHTFYTIRGEMPPAYDLAQQMLRIADAVGERTLQLEAHHSLGCIELRMGALASSQQHLEQAIALSDPADRATAYLCSGHDPKVCCLSYLAVNRWLAGQPDQALRHARAALAWAEAVGHPFSTVQAQCIMGWIRVLRDEESLAAATVNAALATATANGFTYWIAITTMMHGWVAVRQGHAAGLDELRRGFAICEMIGPGVGKIDYLVALADACIFTGATSEGLHACAVGIETAARHGERYLEAEMHRLRGVLLQQSGEEGEAIACFERAVGVAREQQARGLERRAAKALAQYRKRQRAPRNALGDPN
jgi:tetratricopeptide (TPR) repeat protein